MFKSKYLSIFLLSITIAISSCYSSKESNSSFSQPISNSSVGNQDSNSNHLGILDGVYELTSYEIHNVAIVFSYVYIDFSIDQNVHVIWEHTATSGINAIEAKESGESVYSYSLEIDKNEDGVKKEYIDFTYLSGNEMTSIVFKKHNQGCYLMLSNDHNSIYYHEIIYGGSIVSPDGQVYHQNLDSTAEFTLLNE